MNSTSRQSFQSGIYHTKRFPLMATSLERTEQMDQAAKACLEAYGECKASSQHCLNARRDDRVRSCAGALEDCADVSLLLGNLLLRNSPMVLPTVGVAMDAARHAASAISALEHADGQLRAAYAACQNLLRVGRMLSGGDTPDPGEDERHEALLETFPASDSPPAVSQAT